MSKLETAVQQLKCRLAGFAHGEFENRLGLAAIPEP